MENKISLSHIMRIPLYDLQYNVETPEKLQVLDRCSTWKVAYIADGLCKWILVCFCFIPYVWESQVSNMPQDFCPCVGLTFSVHDCKMYKMYCINCRCFFYTFRTWKATHTRQWCVQTDIGIFPSVHCSSAIDLIVKSAI